MSSISNTNEIQLVFPQGHEKLDEDYESKGEITDKLTQGFVTTIDNISQWFDKYQIEKIELWIQGGIETDGILKLLISAKGEGGMKVTLTPKETKM